MARKVAGKTSTKRKSPASKKKVTAKQVAKRASKTAARKSVSKKAAAPKRGAKPSKKKSARSSSNAKRSQTKGIKHPGMMGDGTEEQNLNEAGSPGARITKDEVDTAFNHPKSDNS